jgi:superoxide dismutase, Fe-Mn family
MKPNENIMSIKLSELPYAMNALEPHISKETVSFHYTKHHQGYVDKLNAGIKGTEFESMCLEDIIKQSSGGIFNNAAQTWNHTFYWESLAPNAGGEPSGKLADEINKKWGSFESFKAEFNNQAATLFGSGWAWLVKSKDGDLSIVQTSNAGCPITDGLIPLLTCDVWEHAYYLDQQNKRPDYISAFWNLVNWKAIESRFIA